MQRKKVFQNSKSTAIFAQTGELVGSTKCKVESSIDSRQPGDSLRAIIGPFEKLSRRADSVQTIKKAPASRASSLEEK